MLGNKREIKLKVLKDVIREVDRLYQGNNKEFLEDYIEEHIKNHKDATDEQLDECLKCFINLRDKKLIKTQPHWCEKYMK